jgi:hypothetical protein
MRITMGGWEHAPWSVVPQLQATHPYITTEKLDRTGMQKTPSTQLLHHCAQIPSILVEKKQNNMYLADISAQQVMPAHSTLLQLTANPHL